MKNKIFLIQGDITQQDVDALVNAANSSLLGGGGVDGAIHRAGGPEILRQCREILARQGPCPTGQAVITTGGNLKARYVIHTVGPRWRDGSHGEDLLLQNAYQNSLRLAEEYHLKSIAFPSISTGAYACPISWAAQIALHTVASFDPHSLQQVFFILFSEPDLQTYQKILRKIINHSPF